MSEEDNFIANLRCLGFDMPSQESTMTWVGKKQHRITVTLNRTDWSKSSIDFGPGIKVHHSGIKKLRQRETLVVLGCVISLLEKGYEAKLIELEKTWPLGHTDSGRLDILLRDPKGQTYAMIECKTDGREYAAARNKTLEDGGQLFSYFQQDRAAKSLYLYSSRFEEGISVELAEFIRCESLTGVNVEELHDSWGGSFESLGIFRPAASLYNDEFRGIVKSQLISLSRDSGEGVFHSFREVLRRHVISDKPNAFNKIFNLFLCKIADEDDKADSDEMDFQWKVGDSGSELLERLSALYRRGLSEYLRLRTDDAYHSPINEFAFVDVFDRDTFEHNNVVLREVVELLQNYRIKYSARHQSLGDFFELLLGTSIKQEVGQFFTPSPLARAILRSMPIQTVIESKILSRRTDVLPYIIDFACGAGHFLTEAIEEIHKISSSIDMSRLTGQARSKFASGREAHGWTSEFLFGIEKDYRLAKVTKIATFLNGDGDANIIRADGLAPFASSSGYPPPLVSDDQRRLAKFDIVVANPPFSVDNFRRDVEDGSSRFRLYKYLSADSGEIECLFLERASQLLVDGGTAGIIFPLSLLNNGHAIYRATRRLLAVDFEICGMIELRNKTFIATPTTTVCCFLKRRSAADLAVSANGLLAMTREVHSLLTSSGLDVNKLKLEINALADGSPSGIQEAAYESDLIAHGLRILCDAALETVVAFSGDTVQEQQRVLGYRHSKSRNSEGYTEFIENDLPQTMLYDVQSLTNQRRFSGAVLARFESRALEIPSDIEDVSRFMLGMNAQDIWKMSDLSIENPSAFFVTETSVESSSPFGDFIDDLDGSDQTLGEWLDDGRCVLVRGATYPKSAETPRESDVRILTASNLNLATRKITLQQFRYLSSESHVAVALRPVRGDIVICTASGSLKHLGKIAVATDDISAYIGGFLSLFRCPDPLDQKILEYNLLSVRFRQLIARAKEQNINNLTETKLRPFLLHIPSDPDEFHAEVRRYESVS